MGAIAVTGASGLLGAAVCQAFAAAGRPVLALYHGNPDLLIPAPGIEPVRCDLSDADAVARFAELHSFDALIHSAALTDVERCEREPDAAWRAQVLATRHVARAAASRRAWMLYVSTPSVFDGVHGGYRETDAPRPCNVYSVTKLLGEEAALGIAAAVVMRVTVVGRHPRRTQARNLLEWLADGLRNGRDLRLFTDAVINPLTPQTIAGLVVDLERRHDAGLVLHAGTRDRCSKADVGRYLLEHAFPAYRGHLSYGSASGGGLVAPRGKALWVNVERIEAMGLAMPSIADELARMAAQVAET